MKKITKSVAVAGVTVLAVTTMLAKGKGESVHTVHFSEKVVFTNDNAGVDSSASASAQESTSINGNSDHETLTVTAKGLTPSGPYSLFATVAGTNLDALDFNADTKGNAKLTLKNSGNTKKLATLPGELDPLFGVTELDIVNNGNSNAVTVLTADTTTPKTFTFMDKLSETGTNGETGNLTVSASNKGAKLSLTASAMTPSTDFQVVVNGTSTTNSFTSDSRGNLKVNAAITANVLDLNEVDLTDTSSDVIIAFPLP